MANAEIDTCSRISILRNRGCLCSGGIDGGAGEGMAPISGGCV